MLIGTDRSPLVACGTLSAAPSCRQQHTSGCICSCSRCSRRIAKVSLSLSWLLTGHAFQTIMAHGGAANADAHADGRRAGLLATHASSPSCLGHRTRSQSGCPPLRRRRSEDADGPPAVHLQRQRQVGEVRRGCARKLDGPRAPAAACCISHRRSRAAPTGRGLSSLLGQCHSQHAASAPGSCSGSACDHTGMPQTEPLTADDTILSKVLEHGPPAAAPYSNSTPRTAALATDTAPPRSTSIVDPKQRGVWRLPRYRLRTLSEFRSTARTPPCRRPRPPRPPAAGRTPGTLSFCVTVTPHTLLDLHVL